MLRERVAARDAPPQRRGEYLRLRNKLVAANVRLVVAVAKTFHGLPLEDLTSEGVLGAIRGLETFDPGRGVALSTYISWWIKHYVRRAIHDHGLTIRVPVHIQDSDARLRKAAVNFESKHGHPASPEELATLTRLPLKTVEHVGEAPAEPCSLDAPIPDREGGTFYDITAERGESALDVVLQKERVAAGRAAFESVSDPRSREIVEGRFGFGARRVEQTTLQQIAERRGISRERVRQLQNEVVRGMRRAAG